MARASLRFVRRLMASPDSEGALEEEATAQPGARAGEPCERDQHRFRKATCETREEAARRAECRADPCRIAGETVGGDRLGREDGASHRGADALPGDVAREAGGVADEREPLARDAARPGAADRVGMPPERRQREISRQTAARVEAREEA